MQQQNGKNQHQNGKQCCRGAPKTAARPVSLARCPKHRAHIDVDFFWTYMVRHAKSNPGGQIISNPETKTNQKPIKKRTQKNRERAGGESCVEAAFCKGDPAPRASLRKKLLRANLKNNCFALKTHSGAAVFGHVLHTSWLRVFKWSKHCCGTCSKRGNGFQ